MILVVYFLVSIAVGKALGVRRKRHPEHCKHCALEGDAAFPVELTNNLTHKQASTQTHPGVHRKKS